ncbi:uncharacterized protein LOC130799535 [Amaranthus tricolor]|uniref:uncharacterized protein LOC130799535 n=1 Tax=Amaranthus tricolor TaxID=29722 RepID=UPI00259112B9|nr:uncharacterized protein LOC130799535 [Amaranthus tricolor]
MAAGWVKSLQCKSRAVEDVFTPQPKQILLTSTSCKNSFQNLKDVVNKPKPKKSDPFPQRVKRSDSVKPRIESGSNNWVRRTVSAPLKGPVQLDPFFLSVTELQVGHPSRNVVEIIFHTRWGPKGFSGRVEAVFKIHNLCRTVTRFEEYRDYIKSRAGPDYASGRCVADGNEMMRFHCLGPTNSGSSVIDGCDGVYEMNGAKGVSSVCTYSGSGAAHESAGGGRGRRAMLVCRVIAGRVSKRVERGDDSGTESNKLVELDSVSEENGELLVFDSRAVLPCFLVIYKL